MIELQEHLENFGMMACPVDNGLKIFWEKICTPHSKKYDSAETK